MTANPYVFPTVVGGLAGVAVFLALSMASPFGMGSADRPSRSSAGLQKLGLRSGAGGSNKCNVSAPVSAAATPVHIISNSEEDAPPYDRYTYHEERNPPGTCVLDLPPEWEPPASLNLRDDYDQPWTGEEQAMADHAAQKGLDELLDFFGSAGDARIKGLGTNGANALIDQCFASRNKPEFHRRACAEAGRVLKIIAPNKLYELESGEPLKCKSMRKKTKMLAYAHYLHQVLPGDKELKVVRAQLLQLVQGSFDACKDLDEFLDVRSDVGWEANLDLKNPDALHWSVLRDYIHQQGLINLYSVPDFVFPDIDEVDRFVWRFWTFGGKYNYHDGNTENGFRDEQSRHAYQLTHIAYWPTGYGRHRQRLSDAEWVHDYVRRNFWAAVRYFRADPDLMAEFVDILRNVGCTEDDDLMVRYGSRIFLEAFKRDGETFMSHTSNDYSRIHGPWTAIAAVDRREWEPIVPGSHGYEFRRAFERGEALEKALNS